MILTDKDFLIINLLRPRITGDEKFLVKETYTLDHTIKSRCKSCKINLFPTILNKFLL